MEFSTKQLYTEHPFGQFDYNRKKYYENSLLVKYISELEQDDVIYDIGCGKGWIMSFLKEFINSRICGIDLSPSAVDYCKSNGLDVFEMNNMSLKFDDEISDYTISSGVIHHTPNPRTSFDEIVRITKKKKKIYLSVYKKYFFYYYLYKLAKPLRMLYSVHKNSVMRIFYPIFRYFYFVPMFILLERRLINKETSLTLFADQILTPQATFHTKREISGWIRESGCKLLDFAVERKGQMISFIIEKQ